MKKNNNNYLPKKEDKNLLNEKEKTEQIIDHNQVLDKNHSFQDTITNNKNKSKPLKRKNKFREVYTPWKRQNQITSNPIKNKSKNKIVSKPKIKIISKNKKINDLQEINQPKNISQHSNYNDYNNIITEHSNFSSITNNNNFATNNTTSIGAHTSNNTIMTISGKIPSNLIDQSSKTIPVQKQKDKNNNNKDIKDSREFITKNP